MPRAAEREPIHPARGQLDPNRLQRRGRREHLPDQPPVLRAKRQRIFLDEIVPVQPLPVLVLRVELQHAQLMRLDPRPHLDQARRGLIQRHRVARHAHLVARRHRHPQRTLSAMRHQIIAPDRAAIVRVGVVPGVEDVINPRWKIPVALRPRPALRILRPVRLKPAERQHIRPARPRLRHRCLEQFHRPALPRRVADLAPERHRQQRALGREVLVLLRRREPVRRGQFHLDQPRCVRALGHRHARAHDPRLRRRGLVPAEIRLRAQPRHRERHRARRHVLRREPHGERHVPHQRQRVRAALRLRLRETARVRPAHELLRIVNRHPVHRLRRARPRTQHHAPLAARLVRIAPLPFPRDPPRIGIVIAAVVNLGRVIPVMILQLRQHRQPVVLEIPVAQQVPRPLRLRRRHARQRQTGGERQQGEK